MERAELTEFMSRVSAVLQDPDATISSTDVGEVSTLLRERRTGPRSSAERRPPPSLIEITCDGVLAPVHHQEFGGWEVQCRAGQTKLIGRDVDQQALHGALDRLNSLGLHLLEVSRYPQIRL